MNTLIGQSSYAGCSAGNRISKSGCPILKEKSFPNLVVL